MVKTEAGKHIHAKDALTHMHTIALHTVALHSNGLGWDCQQQMCIYILSGNRQRAVKKESPSHDMPPGCSSMHNIHALAHKAHVKTSNTCLLDLRQITTHKLCMVSKVSIAIWHTS